MDAAERALLAETVDGALSGIGAAPADPVLAEIGWLDMLDAEPDAAVAIVFSALGRTNASSRALDDVVVRAMGLTPRPDLAVVLPPFGSPMFAAPTSESGAGLATARIRAAADVVVAQHGGACIAPIAAVEYETVRGIDPNAGLARVVQVDLSGARAVDGPVAISAAVAWGQRALAYETAGACRAMLDLARDHALGRVQFDRPVARFQAVRHKLAEALVAIEALEAALEAAADDTSDQPLELARLAKAVAGRTARTVGTHCQQVLAGIGFTTDHPFHRHLKRTMILDGLFGSSDELVVAIGRDLLATRAVPTLIEL